MIGAEHGNTSARIGVATGLFDIRLFIDGDRSKPRPPDMCVAREEIFGPVLAAVTVDSLKQTISVANDTPYGPAASVLSAHVKPAHNVEAKAIQTGAVTVYCFSEVGITTPLGGFKQSGFGSRNNSIHATINTPS